MAKKKAVVASQRNDSTVYMLLGVVIVLLLISIIFQVVNRQDNITSWAVINSRDLHSFFGECRGGGGIIDVRPNSAPSIIFLCNYEDRTVEHTLSPGRR